MPHSRISDITFLPFDVQVADIKVFANTAVVPISMTPQNQKSAEDLETRYSGGGIGSPEKACGCTILNSVIFRFFKKATDNERIFITCKLYFTRRNVGLV